VLNSIAVRQLQLHSARGGIAMKYLTDGLQLQYLPPLPTTPAASMMEEMNRAAANSMMSSTRQMDVPSMQHVQHQHNTTPTPTTYHHHRKQKRRDFFPTWQMFLAGGRMTYVRILAGD
jgi:hypothetical protein